MTNAQTKKKSIPINKFNLKYGGSVPPQNPHKPL